MAVSPSSVRLGSGLQLQYVEQGAAFAPPVVLLPGLGDSLRSFEPVLDHLPRQVRAFAVSPRGHGGSDHPVNGYALTDYAADVVAFLDATGLDRAVLVGHSSSAVIARLVAVLHPDRVSGLVQVGAPYTVRGNAAATELYDSELAGLRDPVPHAFVWRFTAATVGAHVPEQFLTAMVQEGRLVPARVWRETFRDLIAHDGTWGLERIAAPTLLVWGDTDAIIARREQDALRAAIPDARLVTYAGLGHSPHWEDPARFSRDLAAFLLRGPH